MKIFIAYNMEPCISLELFFYLFQRNDKKKYFTDNFLNLRF